MQNLNFKDCWYNFARWICRLFCVLFFRYRAHGIENVPEKGPVLLVSNHQSFLDPIFAGAPLKRVVIFMARDTLFTNPIFGNLIRSVQTIPIKRDQADITAIKTILDRLKQQKLICLFPEGTRAKDGKITEFKPGFGLLCKRSKAAIVPVVVEGAFEAWPRHKKIFSPAKIDVFYGKPIYADKSTDNKILADQLTNQLRDMQNQLRRKIGKPELNYSSQSKVNI